MKILNENDIHLKFLLGLSIPVDGIGELKSPLLKDIVDLTEESYNMALSSIFFDRKNLDVDPEQVKDLSDFEILSSIIYHDGSFRDVFFDALELHFGKTPRLHEQGFVYFDEASEETVLTDERFGYMKKLIRIANNLAEEEKEEDEIIAGNERARQFMEEQKKRKALLAKLKKPKINLHSIISAVGWKSKSFDFINQLNIYQLYNGYSRFQLFDNYHYTMNGIYAGTIDTSKLKLEDINWANIFNT
ncbi:hypothetical protein BAOM_3116 [Peribacillus asahii]|uniref:Uncharacterized protein n=1 Tax=Peribacillus asahii TaxID=228899 RepID=A0A3Q9RNF9_9BACI|nr:hypothetical protein [Peribacillus asahii]AZV43725.1 hypothetical protein BAOM_3116 [Peribacillus asahii]